MWIECALERALKVKRPLKGHQNLNSTNDYRPIRVKSALQFHPDASVYEEINGNLSLARCINHWFVARSVEFVCYGPFKI